MRNFIATCFILSLFCSCQYFDRTPDKDVLIEKELKTINWNEVDEFPSIAICDSVEDEKIQRQCFFQYLTLEIQQRLDGRSPYIRYAKLDTINVKVIVLPDSTVQFKPQFSTETVRDTLKIDSIIQARLADFPKISPAIKRDIPVKVQFLLPVILKTD